MLDVGAVAARSGPPVAAEEEAKRLVPAIEGLAERAERPDLGRHLLGRGRRPRPRRRRGGDQRHQRRRRPGAVRARGGDRLRAGPDADRRARRERTGAPRHHDDPIEHLRSWFSERIEAALGRGVSEEQIALDPGLDFDLSVADDLEILRRLGELRGLGRPLFVSLSRKDFLGAVLAGSWEERAPAEEREWATAAATALAVAGGADLLRLHDPSALQALRIAGAIRSPERAEVTDG